MTKSQDSSPVTPDHCSHIAIASIWILLVALIVVIETGSLFISRSMLAAVLH